jgi:hypothetical protein
VHRYNKKPDIKAPRFRTQKWRYSFINRELYEEFLKENPKYHIEYEDFKLINSKINEEIIDLTINNREGVTLPKGMGRFCIGLFPTKNNLNSGDMRGKIMWDFKYNRYKIRHKVYYGFVAHRTFKRTVSKALGENYGMYLKIRTIQVAHERYKIRKLIKSERNKLNNQVCDQPSEDTTQGS